MHVRFSSLPIYSVFSGLGRTGLYLKVSSTEYRRFLHVDRALFKATKQDQARYVSYRFVSTLRGTPTSNPDIGH